MFTSRLLQTMALAGALLFPSFSQASVLASTGTVYLSADPGHSVGFELNGDTVWRHGVDGTMYGNDNVERAHEGVNLFFERGGDRWLLQFVAPLYDEADDSYDGQPLRTGLYDNVSGDWRFEPMQAGMLISSPLGMTWDWSGRFNVLEIAYAPNGDLARFAVDFIQYDTLDQTGPALRGSLRYNSSIAIAEVPEPATLLLAGLALAAVAGARRARVRA